MNLIEYLLGDNLLLIWDHLFKKTDVTSAFLSIFGKVPLLMQLSKIS